MEIDHSYSDRDKTLSPRDSQCGFEPGLRSVASSSSSSNRAESKPVRTETRARKRTKTGCITCRRRRIKCGEEKPVCQNCIRSKRTCESAQIRPMLRSAPALVWPAIPSQDKTVDHSILKGSGSTGAGIAELTAHFQAKSLDFSIQKYADYEPWSMRGLGTHSIPPHAFRQFTPDKMLLTPQESQDRDSASATSSETYDAFDFPMQSSIWRRDLKAFLIWFRCTRKIGILLSTFTTFKTSRDISMQNFNVAGTQHTATTNTNSQSSYQNLQASNVQQYGQSGREGKRKRMSHEDRNESPESNRSVAGPSSESSGGKRGRKLLFACHFHKQDRTKFSGPGRYKSCPNGYGGINRLKQHISYVHAPQFYCKRCQKIFKTQDEKDSHDDQEVRCERGDPTLLRNMITTDKQREALKKKPATPPTTDYKHWYQMWTFLFNDMNPPTTPYKEADPALVDFLDYAEGQTQHIIGEYRSANPNVNLPDAILSEFYRFALGYLMDEYTIPTTVRTTIESSSDISPPEVQPGTFEFLTFNPQSLNDNQQQQLQLPWQQIPNDHAAWSDLTNMMPNISQPDPSDFYEFG